MRRLVALIVLLALAFAAGGCAMTGTVLANETLEESLEVDDGTRILVETFNGRISVITGGDSRIEARVVKRGSGRSQEEAERDLERVELSIVREETRVTIAVRRNDAAISLGNSGADIELSVPRGSSLELRTSNGRIESANVTGSIIARSSNGGVTIRDAENVDAETSNGPLTVTESSGRLELRTSNGELDIVAAEDVVVTAETSNGSLSFSGTLDPGFHLFRTSNAGLSVLLPSDAEFAIDGKTSNASVASNFLTLTVGENTLSGVSTDNGVPEVQIRAETSNGPLTVVSQP
ncbi:MAG: DUF4097 family beta strand repeat-containing protein [Chloroflexota bacterium]|nr:DUF4097 family beta strand repeat-containing protein [Chloroflexota bacterium]